MNNPLFIGINLGGESTSRTSVALFEFNNKQNKLKFKSVFEKVGAKKRENSDLYLKDLIESFGKPEAKKKNYVHEIAINAPLSLPPCLNCNKSCSFNNCLNREGRYLEKLSKLNKKMLSQNKKFLPYIYRPCDAYIRTFVDSILSHHEPMNANNSHLAARSIYIKEVLLKKYSFIESYPKLTLSALRKKFKLLKKQVVSYNSISNGKFYKTHMIEKLEEEIEIPEIEKSRIINRTENFCAFIQGYLSYLNYIGETESPPSGFPGNANWIYYPKTK